MMRCCCCNRVLNSFESTRRHAETGEFLDICNSCIVGLGIPTIDRPDLATKQTEKYDDVGEEYVETDQSGAMPSLSEEWEGFEG